MWSLVLDRILSPLEVGIFARTYAEPTLPDVLDAIRRDGFRAVHFNFRAAGLAAMPDELEQATCRAVSDEFGRRELAMVGVSATYNSIHPDLERRSTDAAKARRIIELAPSLGTDLVTLCTGTRDPDDMWRAHPDNDDPPAWRDLLDAMHPLVEAAEAASVFLGIEPEGANVVSSAPKARTLIDQLGSDRVKVVLDPANLLTPPVLGDQRPILSEAFDLLAADFIQVHAKDIDEEGHCAAGRGLLDYGLYFELLARYRVTVPIVLHELDEGDAPRARRFLSAHRSAIGL